MNWQVAVIVTGVMSAVAQAMGKRQVAKMSAFQSGLIRDLATWGLVMALYLFQGTVRLEWASLIFLGLGLMEAVAMAAYYSAQREQMAATAVFSYPFSQLLIIVTAGIWFHEWQYFDPRSWQGVVNTLGVVGLIILMIKFQQRGEKQARDAKWSTKLILSSFVIVASNLLAKWGTGTLHYSPVEYMFFEYLGIVLGGIIFVYGRGLNLRLGKENWVWGILQGLLFGAGALWYIGIIAEHPLSLSSVVRRAVIVLITVLFGLWGFGENRKLSRSQKWMLMLGMMMFGMVIAVNR